MARWVVWSQAGIALLVVIATLADQGAVPDSLFPPQAILYLCLLSVYVMPAVVIVVSRRLPGVARALAILASVALAVFTYIAFSPMFS